jgi:hypothetical protein
VKKEPKPYRTRVEDVQLVESLRRENMSGNGTIFTDDGEEPATKGDVVLTPRGHWQGFRNTPDDDALLIWSWGAAGLPEASRCEVGH